MNKTFADYLIPPSKERLPENVAAQIKGLILSKKIREGEKLPSERELTVLLKVSRVVIRQALGSLEQSGLIEIKRGPQGGAFIINRAHKPLADYIRDLIFEGDLKLTDFIQAREAIEIFNIKIATEKATSEDIKTLRLLNSKNIEKLKRSNTEDWVNGEVYADFYEINKSFHIALAEISGNPLIKGITRSLLDNLYVWSRFQKKGKVPTNLKKFQNALYKRHERIIDTIEKREVKKCVRLIKEDVGFHKELDS